MIPKKEEIQRQILIYLIEDQVVSQKKSSQQSKNVASQMEKQESGPQNLEGRQSFSVTVAQPPQNNQQATHNANNAQSATKSLYEESNNSVYSLNFTNPNKKKSDDILQTDSGNKSKEPLGENIPQDQGEKSIKVFPLDTIKYSLQLIGFKYKDASQFCDILKENYKETVAYQNDQSQSLQDAFGKFKMARAYLLSSQLYRGIVEFAQSNNYIKQHKENAAAKLIQYFEMCMQILQKKFPLIILLGGTSGTGKSTLSSILASRFQIPTVLSTDSIRHIIRNFMDESEEPLLFTSTYEAGKILKDDSITKESKKTIQGYKIQCKLVQQKLENVIAQYAKKNEPMIIEGVHLTPRFMFSMMKKYPYVIPFTICIEKESKHRQRFAVRSKYMTLDKKKNKYIQYISNIRMIQAWFMEKSDEHLIPKINNVNIDKSVNIIHRVVTTYMRSMINDQMSIIPDKCVNALKLYKSFNKVIKPLINKFSVSQEVNKNIVMQKFLDEIDKEESENNNQINQNQNSNAINTSFNNANNSNSNGNSNNTSQHILEIHPIISINNNPSLANNVNNIIAHNGNTTIMQTQTVEPLLKNGSLPPISKVSSSNYSLDIIVSNRNQSPSVDLISIEQNLNTQVSNNLLGGDLVSLQKKQSQNSSAQNNLQILPQNSSNNNSANKDPNILLNQFLNDLENKHPKSFVEYTLKKIEDMKQTALKEFQHGSPLQHSLTQNTQLNTLSLAEQNQIKQQKNGQQTTLKVPSENGETTNEFVKQSSKQQSPNNQNTQPQIKTPTDDFNQLQTKINNDHQVDHSENQKQQVVIKINGQHVENKQEEEFSQIEDKQLINTDDNNQVNDEKLMENNNKKSKKKKKLQMDERSNHVTIHSSHNEEQVNNEQQSEGDSLRMGEDNYQFDVLSEGEEIDEDLGNPEEHSNSIDDEEEDDYHDNFGNQSDVSSDQDEEKKDDYQANEDEEDDEDYDDEDDEDNSKPYIFKLDVVQELDPQQLESLSYEGYQNYIKSIQEIVEAAVNQQKSADHYYKSQQSIQHRKKLHQSKSQLFHSEEEVKSGSERDQHKKIRQRSGKHDRQLSFFKKHDVGTPQHQNNQQNSQQSSMTQSVTIYGKKRTQKSSRTSRKNVLSQVFINQKHDITEKQEDISPTPPVENRAKSCDPDKSNLNQKNFLKNKNESYSHFKDPVISQIPMIKEMKEVENNNSNNTNNNNNTIEFQSSIESQILKTVL